MSIADLKKEDFAWLAERSANTYSQNGEDGILEAIFERIGTANQWCCECGAADGVFFSNTKKLIDADWNALLIEADEKQFKKLEALYPFDKARLFNTRVTPNGDNSLDRLLSVARAPLDLDLLVIDVDGQDYWLFNSLVRYRPRVVVVEYDPNAEPDFVPPLDGQGQAGLQAVIKLGIGKRYYPVCATWCNVIFVQQELVHLVAGNKPAPKLSPEPLPKPSLAPVAPKAPKIIAVISIPQLGHNTHMGCCYEALQTFGISLRQCYGVFWNQVLTNGIEEVLAQKPDYVLTLDYDALFTAQDVADLVTLAVDNPGVDVIIPCMTKREGNGLLAHTANQDPEKAGVNLNDPLIPIQLGHFGLTLFKASVFDRIEKPWMMASTDETGGWRDGHIDADMNFWLNCSRAGIDVRLARYVRVGHIEYMATIPNADDPRNTDYVHVGEWRKWAVEQNKAVNERLKRGAEALREADPDAEAFAVQKARVKTTMPIIFDVGAHYGAVAKRYRELFPAGLIYSFEPNPDAFAKLEELASSDRRIVPIEAAVAMTKGNSVYHRNAFDQTNSLLPADDRAVSVWGQGLMEPEGNQLVPTITIDGFVSDCRIPYIDILKLDIQGGEYLALRGAEKMLSRQKVGLIYMEYIHAPTYQGQQPLDAYLTLLGGFGYTLLGMYNPISRDGQLLQADLIFVPREKDNQHA